MSTSEAPRLSAGPPGQPDTRVVTAAGKGDGTGTAGSALMQIGEVAERTGLSLRTIRHYDEVGLVAPSARSRGGFRLYTEADIDRLTVIKGMKPLGFTLEQMRDLLHTLDRLAAPRPPANSERADLLASLQAYRQAAQEHRAALLARVAIAEEFAGSLAQHIDALDRDCPGAAAGS